MTIPARSALVLAAVAGAVGWLAITLMSGRREAWDSELYFGLFLPAIAILVAWLGFLSPRGAWRWAFVPFAAQALIAFVQNPTGGLLPLGFIVFVVLGVVCLVPAVVGAWFRRWYDRQGGSA
jgi:ribose/xylose/arabinose/galactoside ABC-type transport system permease subunit